MKIAIKSGDPAKHACDLLLVPVFGAALKGRALDLDAAPWAASLAAASPRGISAPAPELRFCCRSPGV